MAAKNGDSLLLKQLIDHSALKKYVEKYKNSADQTIDKKHLDERYYASKLLLDAAQAGVPKAIKLLLDYGARIMVDGRGNTPLHKAVVVADKHTIEMIRDLCFYQRATISQGNDDGDTPLHVVLKNPDVTIKEYVVKIVSEYGADPNACNRKGDTPLINAVQIDSPLIGVINAILKALANKKIKPNTQNNKGETALICAAAKGKSHIAVVNNCLKLKEILM